MPNTSTRFLLRPHDLVAVEGQTWVTDFTSPVITVVAVPMLTPRARIRLPAVGYDLALRPTGEEMYVVEASSDRKLGRVSLGGPPHHVAVDGGRAYVATGPPGLVVIDTARRQIIARVRVGRHPHDVVSAPGR